MEDNRPKPKMVVEPFETPCRVHGCFSRAKYRIGLIEGSPGILYHICENCAKSIVASIPQELKPEPIIEYVEVIKEVQVPFAEVETVKEQAIVKKEVEVKKAPVKKKGSK